MLKDSQEKTALAHKLLVASIAALAIIAGLSGYLLLRDDLPLGSKQGECFRDSALETLNLQVGDKRVDAEVAVTGEEKAQGLSGRDCLSDSKGMLFTYELSGDYCYWMKDMNFAIDIIWFDDDKKLVTIADNVDPNTYPQSFCPDKPAQFVLEVPAGYSRSAGWSQGTIISW